MDFMDYTPKVRDRAFVRALAESNSAELYQVALTGGNVYQKSIDLDDGIRYSTDLVS